MKPLKTKMKYKEMCAALGIEKFSENAEKIYESFVSQGVFDEEFALQNYDDMFPLYKNILHAAEEEIRKNKALLWYTIFLKNIYYLEMDADIPVVEPRADMPLRNLAPLFALLPYVKEAEEKMRARQICPEVRNSVHSAYEKFLTEHKNTHGYIAINPTNFFWARHYLVPDIFPIGSLQFEITTLPPDGIVFKEISGEKVTVLREVTENEGVYSGRAVFRGGEIGGMQMLPKSHFTKCLVPGDDIISVHIPQGAKVDAETVSEAYKKAQDFFERFYPERHIKAFYCRSWLMDPSLAEILREGSNILSFQRFFGRYPVKSSGKEVFSFVYPFSFENYAALPETTSLMRNLKKRYIENNPIYVYAGIHIWKR